MEKRTANFTENEVELLLHIVEQYKNIIENKKSDATTWQQKNETWQEITNKFNASTQTNKRRSLKNLKTKYEHLKKDIRKKLSKQKAERIKTGGGPFRGTQLTTLEEKLLSLVDPTTMVGMSARFGGDNSDDDVENFGIAFEMENENEEIIDAEYLADDLVEVVQPIDDDPAPSTSTSTGHKQKTPKKDTAFQNRFLFQNKKTNNIPKLKEKVLQMQLESLKRENERKEELHQLAVENFKLDIEIKKKKLNEM